MHFFNIETVCRTRLISQHVSYHVFALCVILCTVLLYCVSHRGNEETFHFKVYILYEGLRIKPT